MKIVRVLSAVSLALFAAPALAAVPMPVPPKPPAAGESDPARRAWREESVRSCVSGVGEVEGVSGSEIETACGCAADRLAAGRPTEALPTLAPGAVGPEIRGPLLTCAADERPAAAAALVARLAAPAPADLPSDGAKPADTSAPSEAPNRSAPDIRAWFDGLSLPGWIADSGLPTWAWVILGFVAFMVLRGLFRRGERSDLIGPPPNMRLGARANPPAPRRADPPQRG